MVCTQESRRQIKSNKNSLKIKKQTKPETANRGKTKQRSSKEDTKTRLIYGLRTYRT